MFGLKTPRYIEDILQRSRPGYTAFKAGQAREAVQAVAPLKRAVERLALGKGRSSGIV